MGSNELAALISPPGVGVTPKDALERAEGEAAAATASVVTRVKEKPFYMPRENNVVKRKRGFCR